MGNKKKLGLSLFFAFIVVMAPPSFAQEGAGGEAWIPLQRFGSLLDSMLEALWISPADPAVAPGVDPASQPEAEPMIIPPGWKFVAVAPWLFAKRCAGAAR